MTASVVTTHIIGSMLVCGTQFQPWTVEAPVGEKIRINLIDFSAAKSSQAVEQGKQACFKYGIIVDKGNKRNVSICGRGVERERDLYTSTGNVVEIFLNSDDHAKQFMLRVEGLYDSLLFCNYAEKGLFGCGPIGLE